MKKAGAVEWTVGRLMSLVLLIIVLALVIYGVSSGGLNPLIERAQGMIDSVLILFGADDGEQGIRECVTTEEEIEGVGSGIFVRCREKCEIVMDEEIDGEDEYSLDFGEELTFLSGGVAPLNMIKNMGIAAKEREIYQSLMDVFGDYVGDDVDQSEYGFIDTQAILIGVFNTDVAHYYMLDSDKRWSYAFAIELGTYHSMRSWGDQKWSYEDGLDKIWAASDRVGRTGFEVWGSAHSNKGRFVEISSLEKLSIFGENGDISYMNREKRDKAALMGWIDKTMREEVDPSIEKMGGLRDEVLSKDDFELFGEEVSPSVIVDHKSGEAIFYFLGEDTLYGLQRVVLYPGIATYSAEDEPVTPKFVKREPGEGWASLLRESGTHHLSDKEFALAIKIFKIEDWLRKKC